jgi:hypothetical protein
MIFDWLANNVFRISSGVEGSVGPGDVPTTRIGDARCQRSALTTASPSFFVPLARTGTRYGVLFAASQRDPFNFVLQSE